VWVYNTHLSPRAGQQHVAAAEAINDRIAALSPGTPVVVLGDFNATAGSSETWMTAIRYPGSEEEGEGRIDWVLIGGPIEVSSAVTVVHSPQGRYPSDHFPVLARLTIGPS
jgi:endonuclease/exonuclease/phosphatase family metal-dependent hydrolase